MRSFFISLIILCIATPLFSHAQSEGFGVTSETRKGEVVEIISEYEEMNFASDEPSVVQELLLKDTKTGEVFRIYNDYRPVEEGKKVFFRINNLDSDYQGFLTGFNRMPHIIILGMVFMLVIFVFSGSKGIRSLFSLVLSFLAIFFIMIPLILKGANPLIVGPGIAFVILFFAIFISYGFNRVSGVAFLGTSLTVVITSLLAALAIKLFALSGLTDETSLYLTVLSDTPINLVNLLTTGIIIGVLGVLDDIAVTQVAVVRELYLSNPKFSSREVYGRALRVGQDHVSALVNTLVLAYVGVALPLILVFHLSDDLLTSILSQEIFAAEIVRTIVGSIGVVLAVPITTFLAARILGRDKEHLASIRFDGGHSHGNDHYGHNHSHH